MLSNKVSPQVNTPFDPATGAVIAAAPGEGTGHWAGAAGAFADGEDVYLVYRLRWPRPRRGGELIVARGDGETFEAVWRARREDFASPSIERCAILREGGSWRLYVSYVDGVDGRWRVDLIEAGSPSAFDPRTRRPVLGADMANAIAVKDPWLRRVNDRWLMFVSFGERSGLAERLHGSGDALSTGAVKSETGLATSVDGLRWTWEGRIFAAASSGWDRFTTRLTTAVPIPGGEWLGLYDGSASVEENYEERCGLARSPDLLRWTRIGDRPLLGSAGGPGTIRYVESLAIGERVLFFYERTRRDGAHELCLSEAPRDKAG